MKVCLFLLVYLVALLIKKATNLVTKVQNLSSKEQLSALRDSLPANKNDQDQVILDPNPSKALAELTHGINIIPTGEYGHLKPEEKLAFWYLLAQRLRISIMGLSSQYQPSGQATEVLNSLQSLGTDDLVSFVTKVL